MADKYAKIWTSILYDEWFVGLTAIERGIWLQLIITAKHFGDNSGIFQRNFPALASTLGTDRKTLRRVAGKFHDDGKIVLHEEENGSIHITIVKYDYYQEVRSPKDVKEISLNQGKIAEKSRKNLTLPDLTSTTQTLPTQKQPHEKNSEITNTAAPTAPLEDLVEKTPEQMRAELAPLFGWNGQKKKEVVWFDYLEAGTQWLSSIYPHEPTEQIKTNAGSIIKYIAQKAFGKPDRFDRSWPPVVAFMEFLKLAIGEPRDGGGLLANRRFPAQSNLMIRDVRQIFTDGQQTHEFAHAAYQKAGLV